MRARIRLIYNARGTSRIRTIFGLVVLLVTMATLPVSNYSWALAAGGMAATGVPGKILGSSRSGNQSYFRALDYRIDSPTPGPTIIHGPLVTPREFRGDLRTLPLKPALPHGQAFRAPFENGSYSSKFSGPPVSGPPAAEPTSAPGPGMPAPIISFKGLDHDTWGAGWPPDPVGDVGPNHFVQAVNTSIGIFNKTGTRLAAFTFNTMWATAGTGTACDSMNGGDPTVVYDPLADRWFIGDFAFANISSTPFYECIAVSKTNDPVSGGWWLYAIQTDDAQHPWFADYPKMGIWPDGLYMTANMFQTSPVEAYKEVRVWAFNRSDMESGVTVRNVIVDLGTTTYFGLLPSNFRGDPPPAGRENFLVSESQSAFNFEIFKFHVDYSGSGSTFSPSPTLVSQTSYTVASSTVPSPGNSLDSLRERMMMQAQYRMINNTESLWVNHTVRISSGPTAIQWAQIDVTGGTVTTTPVQQQVYGNLNSDNVHRWMGSLAVDKNGDMALGYSASSASVNPDIRYNGRLSTDTPGSLPQGEATMLTGVTLASQTGNCGGFTCTRWGDYSAMTIDPDGCTFWYTNEYYETSGMNWQTRIGAFKFPSCSNGNPALSLTKSALPTTYDHVGQVITYTFTVQNSGDVGLPGPFTVTDNKLGIITPCGTGPLAPAATTSCSATHSITQGDLDAGSISNSATASTTFNQNAVTSQPANASVSATQNLHLMLTKTVDVTFYDQLNDVLNYTLVATNDGNVTLTGVSISDPLLATLSCLPVLPATLAPGQSLSCTGSYAVQQTDLSTGSVQNTATVAGTGPQDQPASGTDHASVIYFPSRILMPFISSG